MYHWVVTDGNGMEMEITEFLANHWQGCQSSELMMALLSEIKYSNDRKIRLLACRFVRETKVDSRRTVWDLLDDRSRGAVEIAERYDQATETELAEWQDVWIQGVFTPKRARTRWAEIAAAGTMGPKALVTAMATMAATLLATKENQRAAAQAQQANIIREMIPVEEATAAFERLLK